MEYSAFLKKTVPIIVRIFLGLLFASLAIGQVMRFSLEGQGGGLLLSDVGAALLLLISMLAILFGVVHQKGSVLFFAICAVAPFLLWSGIVLIARSGSLGYHNTAIASLYYMRLASILLLYPAGVVMMNIQGMRKYTKQVFVYTYVALLFLGFLQFFLFPSLVLLGNGWDPHDHRMVATWLDPNFFGAFLVLFLPIVLLWMPLRKAAASFPIVRALCVAAAGIAILLTRSRSSYFALLSALFICAMFWLISSSISAAWKKAVLPVTIGILSVFLLAGVVLSDRITNLFLHDPTVILRIDAYRAVWERIVVPNIVFGVGYNAYQVAAQQAGLISSFLIHSRSGSDSSLLTLLATTGVVGTALFFIPIVIGCMWHLSRWFTQRNYNSLLFLWTTIALLVHAQFENSLLYPHLLIPYMFIVLLTL